MSTAHEKEQAAGSLRWYADQVETALDPLPALSAEAWDCPAADAFAAGLAEEDLRLTGVAATMRNVAASLDALAAAQREAEAAAAATPPPPPGPAPAGDGSGVPPNVF